MISSSPSPACLRLPGAKTPLGRSERGTATGYHVCPPVFNTSPDAHCPVPLPSHGSGAVFLPYPKEGKGVDGVDGIDIGPGNAATGYLPCVGCLGRVDGGLDTLPRRRADRAAPAPSTPACPPAPERPVTKAGIRSGEQAHRPTVSGSKRGTSTNRHSWALQPRSYRPVGRVENQRPHTERTSRGDAWVHHRYRPNRTQPRPDPVTGRGGGQPKPERLTGRHPYPAGYRAGVALEHLFAFCLDITL